MYIFIYIYVCVSVCVEIYIYTLSLKRSSQLWVNILRHLKFSYKVLGVSTFKPIPWLKLSNIIELYISSQL